MIVWINGAAGSGKTTLARMLTLALSESDHEVRWLDGDDVRTWLTPDCGYSDSDRRKHLRRVMKVAHLISSTKMTVVCSFVGLPSWKAYRHIHLTGRERHPPWEGTTWPKPDSPDLVLDTGQKGTSECLQEILDLLLYSSEGGSPPTQGTLPL